MRKHNHRIGNSNALKWTLEKMEKKIEEVDEFLNTKEGKDIIFIGEALLRCDMYEHQWKYFEKKLLKPIGCDEEDESEAIGLKRYLVFSLLKRVSCTIQARLITKALNFKASVPMTIFILKNQGWSDKPKLNLTTGGEKIKYDGKVKINVINSNSLVKLSKNE